MIDPKDFQEEFAEAMATANTFARRAQKKIPPDRWATEREMHLVAKGIWGYIQLLEWQAEYLKALADANTPD